MLLPAVTGSGESVLVTARSAEAFTVSVSLAVLFPGVGSVVVLATTTVLVCGPGRVEAGTVKAALTVAEPPAASVPRLQMKSPTGGAGAQLPWVVVVAPRVKPAGQVSVRVTLCASEGPRLLTTMV